MSRNNANWIITAQCPSKLGSVDVVTRFLKEQRCYINEQHTFDDKCAKRFFIRTEFQPQRGDFDPAAFRDAFSLRAADFDMSFELTEPGYRVPVIIMVSKTDHCLNDLLYRHRAGKLAIDIKAVISNHELLEPLVAWHGLPYYFFPVSAENRAEQEKQIWQVVEETGAELVVLARYMQVLSAEMCHRLAGRAINIHHSLLPGFKGAKPYHQAYDKGVKLVGATAHFINEDLDEGPIISQKVEVVSHADYADDLVDKGRDIERLTLAHALSSYAERRVFLYENRTVVFSR
ncbi:formyltetrahydrofolate deformylase [Escherichia coli]|nr:formyltetrahydrofolate deformylase [Escherichia coli]EIX9599916.1 formyltetrahydrofolate deformylase [Klebsiella pneumoniae]HBW6184041.1 formyltetrahydrofolate deformylase [Klebsiella pneumoniae]